jgi:hypothetical protein
MKLSKVTLLAAVAAFVALSGINASAAFTNLDIPTTHVPDAGSMMPLVGMALVAADVLRRKLKA